MTPAQENQLLLEHKFLGKVRNWLDGHYPDGTPSGFLHDDCVGMAVNELWEHWVSIMDNFSDDQVKNDFMHDLDEVINSLKVLKMKLS